MDSREDYNSDGQCEQLSDKFVYRARLPSLQEMASYQISIAVWYAYYSTQRRFSHYDDKLTNILELKDCHKLIKTLGGPRFMEEVLKTHVKQVRKETYRCIRHFKEGLFSTNLRCYGIPQFDLNHIVWFPDGRINYKSTAVKMLHSSTLTEIQKFTIMSHFCLENEIKIFNPNLNHQPTRVFFENVDFKHDPVLFYWDCYLKDKLDIVQPFFTHSPNGVRIHPSYLHKHHWETFEYFWDRLSTEDQVSFICHNLSAIEVSTCEQRPFHKMSHDQLSSLVFMHPVTMIFVFLKKMKMPEWALKAWNQTKNSISDEEFVHLLNELLNKYHKKHIYNQEETMSVLLQIWDTASNHHRYFAATESRLEEAIAQQILSEDSLRTHFRLDHVILRKKVAPSGLKFLMKFLSLKSADFRKNLILGCDCTFVVHFDFDVASEILDLCLPDLQDKVEFENRRKESILSSYFFEILYSKDDHNELNTRLLRDFQNLNIASNYTKEFIQSTIIADARGDTPLNRDSKTDWLKLSKFINKIFQENISTVLEAKRTYISSFTTQSDPYERYGSLHELRILVEQEFVIEHMQDLKRKLAENLQEASVERWVWYILEYKKFAAVFLWCFENNKDMFLQLKRAITIDDIIIEVIKKVARQNSSIYQPTPPFNNIERFLEWYFAGEAEEVISFKLDMMNDPKTTKILESIQKDNKQQLHGELLQWIGNPHFLHSETSERYFSDSKVARIINAYRNFHPCFNPSSK